MRLKKIFKVHGYTLFSFHFFECAGRTIEQPLTLVKAIALAFAKCWKFYVKVSYVMGKELLGELSCMQTGLVTKGDNFCDCLFATKTPFKKGQLVKESI